MVTQSPETLTTGADMSRRRFLGMATVLGVAATSLGAAACGSSSSSKKSTPAETAETPATVSFQLGWLPNVEFGGTWIAEERGYFTAKKITADVQNGGPNVSVPPLIVAGKSLIGQTGLDEAANAKAKGADIKVITLLYQRNPYAMASLTKAPIDTPEAMYGKRIGVPAANNVAWEAFVKLNKLDASKITVVPVQFDPTVLVAGEIDGLMAFLTNEPTQPKLVAAGVKVFAFEDFNYHLATNAYIVASSSLQDSAKRDQIVRFLQGELKGWQDSVAEPDVGAQLATDKYGKDLGLDLGQQKLQSAAQNKLIVTDETKANGLGTFSDAVVSQSFATLAASGITVTAGDLMDASVLKDVYAGKPTL